MTNNTHNQNIRLVGVYNADGGIKGELAYVFGKLRGTVHCALCDISHGNGVKPKKSWKDMVCQLPYPLTAVHLNEMDDATAKLVNRANAPAVVYIDDSDSSNNHILLNAKSLETCAKSPEQFFLRITQALDN